MKPNSKTILEDLDTTLNALQEEVAKMRETLLSVRTSLALSESLKPKPQAQVTRLTSVDGLKKHKSKQQIMPKRGTLNSLLSYQRLLSKREGNQ
jgi:hypothetical protein